MEEPRALDVATNPALRDLIEEVSHSRRPRVLRDEASGAEVEVRPLLRARERRRRGRATSADDAFWRLIGIGASGKHDITANQDDYLAQANRPTSP